MVKKTSAGKGKGLPAAYWKGASIRQLARRTGLSYGTVHNWLKAAGTRMRARGGPNHT